MDKGLTTVPKWLVIIWLKMPKMLQNLSAQFVCPSPKVLDSNNIGSSYLFLQLQQSFNSIKKYLWTNSDIIVHSVVFYEEVGSFSLSCGGCFRGCSYSLYYYEVCRFNPSQQPLILESADLGLHSGHFDSYSFHLEKKCLKRKKIFFQKVPILQKLCRFNLYTPL